MTNTACGPRNDYLALSRTEEYRTYKPSIDGPRPVPRPCQDGFTCVCYETNFFEPTEEGDVCYVSRDTYYCPQCYSGYSCGDCNDCSDCSDYYCTCDYSCYGQSSGCSRGCDVSCYGQSTTCNCHQMCNVEARACTCDQQKYGFNSCSACDGCNQFQSCTTCDVACDGDACSQCHHTEYSQPW